MFTKLSHPFVCCLHKLSILNTEQHFHSSKIHQCVLFFLFWAMSFHCSCLSLIFVCFQWVRYVPTCLPILHYIYATSHGRYLVQCYNEYCFNMELLPSSQCCLFLAEKPSLHNRHRQHFNALAISNIWLLLKVHAMMWLQTFINVSCLPSFSS